MPGLSLSDILQTLAVMLASFAALYLLAFFLKAESATWSAKTESQPKGHD